MEEEIQTNKQNQTNPIALIAFISSFFVTITSLILSIIGLVLAGKKEGKWRGFAIAGLVISILKLLFIICIIVMFKGAINFVEGATGTSLKNIIQCAQATKCVEEEDGTYTCKYAGKDITCTFSVEDFEDEIEEQIEDQIEEIEDTKTFYQAATDAINPQIDNVSGTFTSEYDESGNAVISELSFTQLTSVVTNLKTATTEEIEYIPSENNINISLIINSEDGVYNITLIKDANYDTYIATVSDGFTEKAYSYDSLIDIFEFISVSNQI